MGKTSIILFLVLVGCGSAADFVIAADAGQDGDPGAVDAGRESALAATIAPASDASDAKPLCVQLSGPIQGTYCDGYCSALCQGMCSPVPVGIPKVTCEGTCQGTCIGTCDGRDTGASGMANCAGVCNGSCDARCVFLPGRPRVCDGRCNGTCSPTGY